MLKRLLTLLFLLPLMLFAQDDPLVNIALNATDNAAGEFTLNIGLDPNATDGLDETLGEAELPPTPPAGIFDTRLVIGTNTPVNKDFRFGDNSTTYNYTHTIKWQLGDGGTNYTLGFDVPEGVTLVIQDPFGGFLVNETFTAGPGNLTVNNTSLNELKVTATYELGGGITVNAPTDLTAEAVVIGAVNLNWTDNSDNETGFVVEREIATEVYAVLAELPPDVTSYTDETVAEGTTYNYKVKAVANDVSSAYSNEVQVTTLITPVGDAIEVVMTVEDGGQGNIAHKFGIHPEATDGINAALGEAELPPLPPSGIFDSRFILPGGSVASLIDYRQGDNTFNGTKDYKIKWQLGDGATGYIMSFTVPANVEMHVQDPFGGVLVNENYGPGTHDLTVTSASLNELQIALTFGGSTVVVNAPTGLTAQALVVGEVELEWVDNSDNETGFVVEREVATEAYAVVAELGADVTSYTDATVAEGTTYNYRVKAVANDVSSLYSNEVQVTTLVTPVGDAIEVVMTVADGAQGDVTHKIGIHPEATDAIDAALGEAELPPVPPAGVFDSRFILPGGTIASRIDYRQGDNTFTGSKEYTLKWQLGENATGYNVDFTIPQNVEAHVQDPFGGVAINETFGPGTYNFSITNSSLTQLNITLTFGPTTVTVNAPSELSAEAVVIGAVNLSWTDNSDNETGFVVEREIATEAYEVVAELDADVTSYTDETVAQNTIYNYRVKAVANDVSSEYSNVAPVTTLGNTAPVFVDYIDEVTIPATMLYSFQYTAEDNENDDLIFSSNNLPAGADLTEAGLFTWTPEANQINDYSFTVTVSDGSLSDEVTSNILVVPPVTMSAGDVEGLPGEMVYVPVDVTDLNGIGAVTLEMGYDASALSFVSLANVHSSFTGALVNGNNGTIIISWVDNSLQGVDFGETKLFDLKFEYISGESGVTFDEAGSEVSDVLGEVITVTYFDGSVSLAPIRLLTPDGGEELSAGESYEITWAANGFATVNLEYSTDNGANWMSIIEDVSGSDYMWTVPATPTEEALVKVSNASDESVFDISDAVFTILPSTFTVSGTITYDNSNNTPLGGVSVYLYQGDNIVAEAETNGDGGYMFADVANGEYTVKASSETEWGGVNSTDALLIRRHVVQLITLEDLKLEAADVNASNTVNSTDALVVRRRVVQLITSFPAGDWAFESQMISLDGEDVVQDLAGICYGDVNGSYNPVLAKAAEFATMPLAGKVDVNVEAEFEVPVVVKQSTELGAVTFQFEYPVEMAELAGVSFAADGAIYNDVNGRVTVSWAELDPLKLQADDVLMTLKFKPTAKFEAGSTLQLNMGSYTEFANANGEITDPSVASFSVEVVKPTEFSLRQNYPNPFNPSTTIEYDLPSKSNVVVEIYNTVGEKVVQLMDQEQKAGSYKLQWNASGVSSGIYFLRIYAKSENQSFVKTQKMILLK